MRVFLVGLFVVLLAVGAGVWYGVVGQRNLPIEERQFGKNNLLRWDKGEVLSTRLGKVKGLTNGRSSAFLGLPYAEPPLEKLRFMPPVQASGWQETLDATRFPPMPMQSESPSFLGDSNQRDTAEDSLYLNIFTPSSSGTSRPVLFWIHGGSLTHGSANDTDGSILAEQGDVVVVAINYRLGMLGYLDLSSFGDEYAGSASNGFRDQIMALEWVRDNIADYGGDANNVTIFGESAGGLSVLSIIASPQAQGLFHKAIVNSGGPVHLPPLDQLSALEKHLGVGSDGLLTKLTSMSANELISAQEKISFRAGGVDGIVVTQPVDAAIHALGENGVPIIVGSNKNEGTLFSYLVPWFLYSLIGEELAPGNVNGADPSQYLTRMKKAYPEDNFKQRFERIWNDRFRRFALKTAVAATTAGPGGWLYRFDLEIPDEIGGDWMKATHAAEIQFTFNNFASDAPANSYLYDKSNPVVVKLAQEWSQRILAFAKTGNPNLQGLPHWPQYDATSRQSLVLDENSRIEEFLDKKDREVWGDE